MIQQGLQSFINEPAVDGAPRRVSRDWLVVGIAALIGVIEIVSRTDQDWTALSIGWKIASFVVLITTLAALPIRRTQPLLAVAWSFGIAMAFNAAVYIVHGHAGGLFATAVLLVNAYALYRWGSGRDCVRGAAILVATLILGNVFDNTTVGEWIGGGVVLLLPVLFGLAQRYRTGEARRARGEALLRERQMLARELHDSVAHHVSAIAVQAQAGQAMSAKDPARAVEVLGSIEEAASRALDEMRHMIGALRDETEVDYTPQQGIADLPRLVQGLPGRLRVDLHIDPDLGAIAATTDAALYRITQESITNAVRHARDANTVKVEISAHGGHLNLWVRDDGRHAVDTNGHRGYGVRGMRERAQLLGGSLHAGPAQGGGWEVRAELPRGGA